MKLTNVRFNPDCPVETRMAPRQGVMTLGLLAAPSTEGPFGPPSARRIRFCWAPPSRAACPATAPSLIPRAGHGDKSNKDKSGTGGKE